MSARKDDAGKPPLSLIPRSALYAEARVMATGAKKYGAHNWRGGMKWSRLIDAAMRHLTAFAAGQDVDNEEGGSGESHLANARCCLAFLIEYGESGLGEDDRFKSKHDSEERYFIRIRTKFGALHTSCIFRDRTFTEDEARKEIMLRDKWVVEYVVVPV